MKEINVEYLRKNLSKIISQVIRTGEPVKITSNAGNVMLLSREAYAKLTGVPASNDIKALNSLFKDYYGNYKSEEWDTGEPVGSEIDSDERQQKLDAIVKRLIKENHKAFEALAESDTHEREKPAKKSKEKPNDA